MLKTSNRLDIERLIAKRIARIAAQVAAFAASVTPSNRGSIWAQNTTSNQGAGGPTIVALIWLKVQGSGVFRFNARGTATCVAGDQSGWLVQTQTGAGAVTRTGATSTGSSNGIIPSIGEALFASSGVPGTGIAITGGGGLTIQTLDNETSTIGAGATLLDRFSTSGIIDNGNNGAFGPAGTNVFLTLSYTNNTANRQIGGLVLGLEEV